MIIAEFRRKCVRMFYLICSRLIRSITHVHGNKVLVWSTAFKNYGCNPKYITEYLMEEHPDEYDIYWAFLDGITPAELPKGLQTVTFGTFKYLWVLNTSKFLITNHRTNPRSIYWKKRLGQKYIMTWHGTMPLKKIQADNEGEIKNSKYTKANQIDSQNCDLMISDSEWFTQKIRDSFWYNGEILTTGVPRNDIFFNKGRKECINEKVRNLYNIGKDDYVIMYAPTFRKGWITESYLLEWHDIVKIVSKKVNKNVVVMLRLHPTLINRVDSEELKTDICTINVTAYGDMQELLCVTDMLITDYSSTMFEVCLLNKPCFLYIPDVEEYDRGFYVPIRQLPFSLSENKNELCDNINKTDFTSYCKKISDYVYSYFNPQTNSNASEHVYLWMKRN